MFQKLAPLLVLALFGAGVYLMMQGMDNAVKMSQPKSTETKK